MRVTESLLRQNQLKNQKKRQSGNAQEEPTQAYQEKKQADWALNQQKSAFASALDAGINTAPSIFDAKAIFRTKEGGV